MSTSTETTTRPPRAPAASVLLTLAALVAAILLAPVTSAAAAEPLPTGTYEVSIEGGQVTVTVADDRTVTVSASDGLVVQLAFDEQGQALDEFTVRSGETSYEVEIDVADDGSYSTRVASDDDGEPGADGDVVSTVAECTPGGLVAQAVGLPNHGTIVSAAASGLTLSVEVTDPVTGETTPIVGDFSSLDGAEAFCTAVAVAVPSIDEVRDMLAEERAQAAADRAAAQAEREEVREVAKRAREAGREAAALAREAEQAAREAEREAAAEEREEQAAARSNGDTGSSSSEEDTSSTDAGTADSSDGTTTDDDSGTDDGTTDTTTDDTTTDDTTTDDTTTDDTTTEDTTKGNGSQPTEPGSNGKGNDK